MDATIRRLRREADSAPGSFAAAARLAVACERAGLVGDAWEAVERFDASSAEEAPSARELLGGLAARNPRWVLERLLALEIRGARLFIDRLIGCGQATNPALIVLASDDARIDRALRRHAQRAIRTTFKGDFRHLSDVTPEELRTWIDEGALAPGTVRRHGHQVPATVLAERRERWKSFAHRLVDRAGAAQAVALLPWLVPLLTSHDPVLAARALALVQRLTDRDAPPFPVEVLARELGAARARGRREV